MHIHLLAQLEIVLRSSSRSQICSKFRVHYILSSGSCCIFTDIQNKESTVALRLLTCMVPV